MRRQTPIAHLLYAHLFPNPTGNDPPSFSAHLARNLVPEVRIEVATFYGDLNSTEARYPGLNYCYPPHRLRLGRFKHHRRLFDAFDNLGLTYGEIQDFCCWEGTKWARERYEKDEGIKVPDTTGDEIGPFVDRRDRRDLSETRRHSITRKTDITIIVENSTTTSTIVQPHEPHDEEMSEFADTEAASEDEEAADYGVELQRPIDGPAPTTAQPRDRANWEATLRREHTINQRIINAWQQGHSLPADLEQYLKEQSERGTLNFDTDLLRFVNPRQSRHAPPTARHTRAAA